MELRPQGNLAASFGQLARIYERVWYGKMPAGPAEAEAAIGPVPAPVEPGGSGP